MLYVLEIVIIWVSYREKLLIDEWLSDKDLHIIRDHCYHEKHIMGGMGSKKPYNRRYGGKDENIFK